MAYWLIKTEPQVYSFAQLKADKKTAWTGVRNFEARNNLQTMKEGDLVVVYHTGDDKEIAGFVTVVKEAYPDPTAESGSWVSVDVQFLADVGRALGLEELRNTHNLSVMPVVERPRLSVHAVSDSQWKDLLRHTKTNL